MASTNILQHAARIDYMYKVLYSTWADQQPKLDTEQAKRQT